MDPPTPSPAGAASCSRRAAESSEREADGNRLTRELSATAARQRRRHEYMTDRRRPPSSRLRLPTAPCAPWRATPIKVGVGGPRARDGTVSEPLPALQEAMRRAARIKVNAKADGNRRKTRDLDAPSNWTRALHDAVPKHAVVEPRRRPPSATAPGPTARLRTMEGDASTGSRSTSGVAQQQRQHLEQNARDGACWTSRSENWAKCFRFAGLASCLVAAGLEEARRRKRMWILVILN